MIDWTGLTPLYPGRDRHVPDVAKHPTAKKAWNDLRKVLAQRLDKHLPERDPYGWPPPAHTDDAGERALTTLRSLAASTVPPGELDVGSQAVAMELFTRFYAPRDHGKSAAKLATWWTHAAEPAFVVDVLADLWHWTVSEREVERRAEPFASVIGPDAPIGSAAGVLRAWMGRVDDDAYDAGAAAARRHLPQAMPPLATLLAFLFPTDAELVDHAFATIDEQARSSAPHHAWLAYSARDLDTAHGLVQALCTRSSGARAPLPTALLHAAPPEEAVPRMLGHWRLYEPALHHVRHPDVAREIVQSYGPGSEEVERYAERFPDMRPVLGMAAPTEDGPDLPELLAREPSPLPKSAFFRWGAWGPLSVDGQPLSEAHVRRLGMALYRSKGRSTAALEEVRAALDPDPRQAFGDALYRDLCRAQGDGEAETWWMRALWLFFDDGDAFVDRLAKDVASMPWSLAAAALEVALTIGGDRGLQLVAHFAEKAKKRGVRNKAADLLAREAERQGLSADALQDRIVPDLGLPAGRPEVLDLGPVQLTVGLDGTLVPFLRMPDGSRRTQLPTSKSHDADKAAAAKARWSQLRKDLKRVAGTQRARLERAMAEGRTWTAEDFDRYLVRHPLQGPVVRSLLWRVEGGPAFRVDVSGDWADRDDEPVPAEGVVRLVHPAELSADELEAWGQVFADYELLQPVDQLGRDVYRPGDEASQALLDRLDGARIHAASAFGLLQRGWMAGEALSRGRYDELEVTRGGVHAALRLSDGLYVHGVVESELQTVTLEARPRSGSAVAYSEVLRDLATLRLA